MTFKTAIQLYSVRDTFESDPLGCLKALKKMGYDGIELCGWSGIDPSWMRGACDAIGLEIVSIHMSIWGMSEYPRDFAEKAAALGMSYAVIPYLISDTDFPGQRNFATTEKEMIKVSKELSAKNIQLLYHNHGAEFEEKNKICGEYLYDLLMNAFTPDVLQCEIDACWAHNMGVDPAEHILKYKGRIPALHLKDYILKGRGKDKIFTTCPFGDGRVNALEVIRAAKKAGTKWLIVEEDRPYPETKTELDCARKSINNIKKLIAEAEQQK